MAKYNARVLENYVDGISVRIFFTMATWLIVGFAAGLVWDSFADWTLKNQIASSLGRLRANPQAVQTLNTGRWILTTIIGGIIGAVKSARLRVEKHKTLCLMECEKHFRNMAAWTASGKASPISTTTLPRG